MSIGSTTFVDNAFLTALHELEKNGEKLSCRIPCGQEKKEIGNCTCDHICTVRSNSNLNELLLSKDPNQPTKRKWTRKRLAARGRENE